MPKPYVNPFLTSVNTNGSMTSDKDGKSSKSSSGRPSRACVGRKSIPNGFVPSDEVIKPEPVFLSSDEDDGDGYGSRKKTHELVNKRKKHQRVRKSPQPPRVSPYPSDGGYPPPERTPSPELDEQEKPKNLCLTFNIPKGQKGPFTINLDLANLPGFNDSLTTLKRLTTRSQIDAVATPIGSGGYSAKDDPVTKFKSSNLHVSGKGFLDLPAEVRIMIYNLVFTSPEPLNLAKPKNFTRSGSFIATCRQVSEEARPILYGSNKFEFERQSHSRAPLWGEDWKEVGFKDVHRFLKMIGPDNISLLREVDFLFEDGPYSVNGRKNSQDPSFVHDNYVIDSLRLLGSFGSLRKFTFTLSGRKHVSKKDDRFIKYLIRIQADEVDIIGRSYHRLYGQRWSKQDDEVARTLLNHMAREEKLFLPSK